MKATEIMTREVVSVASDTPIRNIAKLMVDQRISGVPVIDHGKLVGIISENDLVRRVELGTEKTRSRWVQFLTSNDTLLAEYVRARGRVARDVMTTNVVTVAPDDSIAAIAEVLETRHIKRVPVVDGGKVVGIVSRANLLQALVAVGSAKVALAPTDDAVIHDAIVAEIEKIAWLPSAPMNNVTVSNGIVHLWGYVGSENERRAVHYAAERAAGVKAVRDHRSELLSPF
jgi:CBS domain-containing protein